MQDRVTINRGIVRLDCLCSLLGPQGFGRAMQHLLAYSFECAGFEVVENAVGVPDYTATPPVGSETISVEVKTSGRYKSRSR